jgi:hypothetical protein
MPDLHPCYDPDDPSAVECYRAALRALNDAGVDYLVGGAYAFARYADVARHTKDLDIFLRPADRDAALAVLKDTGFQTEVTYPHWLAKSSRGEFFIDLIYSSGNGICHVDDDWFSHACKGEVMCEPVRLCPLEETVWSKAFIMERDRYDGADVAHLMRAAGERIDWHRLLARFGANWRVLYSHLVLFGFIYPGEDGHIPEWVLRDLGDRLKAELRDKSSNGKLCRGTLLAALQYVPDVESWGYKDARLPPYGGLTPEDVATWTDGVRTGR